jgi:hypothetical protein
MNIGEVESVHYQATINLGNFESEKLGITIKLSQGQTADEALETARCWVKDNAGKLPAVMHRKIASASATISQQQRKIEENERELNRVRKSRVEGRQAIEKAQQELVDVLQKTRVAKIELNKVKVELGLPLKSKPFVQSTMSEDVRQGSLNTVSDIWVNFALFFKDLETAVFNLKPGEKATFCRFAEQSPEYPLVDLWLSEYTDKSAISLFWEKAKTGSQYLAIELAIPHPPDDEWDMEDEENDRAILGAFDGVQD